MRDNQSTKPIVAVVGDARLPPEDACLGLARDCGRLLVDAGCRVLTGGLGGVMEAASQGAHLSSSYAPGAVLGVLPGHDPADANEFVDIVLATGLDVARNCVVANSDAVLAIGGGAGTLSEIAMAWQLHRLIVALRVPGWSGELADRRVDGRVRYPGIEEDRVFGAADAAEAVSLVQKWLPRYTRRHRRVR